jgi:hypothetical protein
MATGLAVILVVWRATSVPWPWWAAIGSVTTLAVGTVVGLLRPGAD